MPTPVPAQLSLFDEPSSSGASPRQDRPGRTFTPAPATPPPDEARSGAPLPSSPRASQRLLIDGVSVSFELRRSRRRSLGLSIGPEGLVVSAPRWAATADIERAVRDKGPWVLRKLQEQADRARRVQANRIEWREGASVPFLGEVVILVLDPRASGAVLHTAADTLPGVPRLTLHLGLPQGADAGRMRELVQGWLQRQALRVFQERCAHFAAKLGVDVRRIGLSSATTRWGSASADGSIRLHWRLVHFALPVIDYVVAHELAHLREMNHSPAFWDVVRSVLPGFETARVALRQQALPDFDPTP